MAELYDEGQHLIVFGIVEGELRALQQLQVEFGHILQGVLIDLQMSLLALAFLVHHADEVAVPVGHLVFLIVGELELVDVVPAYLSELTTIGTNEVFGLPHIEQILGDVAFM